MKFLIASMNMFLIFLIVNNNIDSYLSLKNQLKTQSSLDTLKGKLKEKLFNNDFPHSNKFDDSQLIITLEKKITKIYKQLNLKTEELKNLKKITSKPDEYIVFLKILIDKLNSIKRLDQNIKKMDIEEQENKNKSKLKDAHLNLDNNRNFTDFNHTNFHKSDIKNHTIVKELNSSINSTNLSRNLTKIDKNVGLFNRTNEKKNQKILKKSQNKKFNNFNRFLNRNHYMIKKTNYNITDFLADLLKIKIYQYNQNKLKPLPKSDHLNYFQKSDKKIDLNNLSHFKEKEDFTNSKNDPDKKKSIQKNITNFKSMQNLTLNASLVQIIGNKDYLKIKNIKQNFPFNTTLKNVILRISEKSNKTKNNPKKKNNFLNFESYPQDLNNSLHPVKTEKNRNIQDLSNIKLDFINNDTKITKNNSISAIYNNETDKKFDDRQLIYNESLINTDLINKQIDKEFNIKEDDFHNVGFLNLTDNNNQLINESLNNTAIEITSQNKLIIDLNKNTTEILEIPNESKIKERFFEKNITKSLLPEKVTKREISYEDNVKDDISQKVEIYLNKKKNDNEEEKTKKIPFKSTRYLIENLNPELNNQTSSKENLIDDNTNQNIIGNPPIQNIYDSNYLLYSRSKKSVNIDIEKIYKEKDSKKKKKNENEIKKSGFANDTNSANSIRRKNLKDKNSDFQLINILFSLILIALLLSGLLGLIFLMFLKTYKREE